MRPELRMARYLELRGNNRVPGVTPRRLEPGEGVCVPTFMVHPPL